MKVIQKGSKKIVSIVLSLMMIFGGLTLSTSNVSAEETSGDYAYEINDDTITVTITGYYTGGNKDVVIPSTIDGKTVTAIGDYALASRSLTSVTIPSSVTTIGEYAFSNNQLKSVIIPSSVTTIGEDAFGCNKLTSVTIPSSVKTIEDGAFGDNQLKSITIPSSVTTIGAYAFYSNKLTSVIIPSTVTSIEDHAFYGNELTSVTIPSSVKTIGEAAFGSNQLTSVTIPEGVTTLNGFSSNQLKSITIPSSVTTIGESAFYGNELTSVTIPSSVKTIGEDAFGDNLLTSVTIPEGVTTLNGFSSNQITSVTIPSSVTTIGEYAFYGNELTSVIIPSTVTSIEDHAFYGNELTSVTIPSSVTTIGNYAFAWQQDFETQNPLLKKVVILGKTTTIGDDRYDVFKESTTSDFKLYGYAGSTAETYAKASVIDLGENINKPAYTFVALKELTIEDIADQGWTGSALEPKLTIKDKNDSNKVLTEGDDYTVTYKNNTNAGTATVTVTGINDYEYATATKDFTIKLPVYKFTEGTDQTITVGDNKDLTFKVDGPLELLDKVYINDEELDAANYTTASGSTIITLKKEYVSTLKAGTYTLKATYTNGVSASTDFVIKAKETTPTTPTDQTTPTNPNVNTGDNSNITLWTSLLMISGLISLGYVVLSKKRKMN